MSGNSLQAAADRLGAVVLNPVKTNTHDHRMQIRSETSSALYTVAWSLSQHRWECSCRGWIRNRRCKHLNAMVPTLNFMVRRPMPAASNHPETQRPGARPAVSTIAPPVPLPAIDAIKAIPQQAQTHVSLQDQLRALRIAAHKLGLYDAADHIGKALEV